MVILVKFINKTPKPLFKKEHSNFIIFKPYGYLSQFKSNDSKQQSKRFLGELHNFPEGTMSIGRLDEKSEGLLLLTTDGKMSDYINSQKVDKEYYALVDGMLTDEAIRTLKHGVEIGFDGKKYTVVIFVILLITLLILGVIYGIYYLLYGILLKRLKQNYKELKKMEV